MNIYFACSITGGRRDESIYQSITSYLLKAGYVVPTAHLAQSGVVDLEKIVDAAEIYKRDVNWIADCDALIAEISTPSHGVGYEIGFALNLGKPVLCLYQEGKIISKMISGNPHQKLSIESYRNAEQAIMCLKDFLEE